MSDKPSPIRTQLVSVPVLPIWREALLALDWVGLRASSVYRGVGIPHGDGAPVILVPGFLGADPYLTEMRAWLKRIGYRPYASGIGQNADCPDILAQRLQATIDQACLETHRKVHLVGHSLGGVIARVAAVRFPHQIAQVITLGSPVNSVRTHPFVLTAARFVRGRILWRRGSQVDSDCYTGRCGCSFLEHVRQEIPSSVLHASIYTRSDGIVDWRSCQEQNGSPNIEVRGTHIGLAFNADVYRNVALLLARKGPTNGPQSSASAPE
jgi:pimeloyl-ACP methyl ester carboxylesterase